MPFSLWLRVQSRPELAGPAALELRRRARRGQEYGYEPPPPDTRDYRVFTYGSDGVLGGEGDARDIDNIMIRKGVGGSHLTAGLPG